MDCTSLDSIERLNNKLNCKRCSWCKIRAANSVRQSSRLTRTQLNNLQLNCNGLKQKLDIDLMQKYSIQIGAIQETNLI